MRAFARAMLRPWRRWRWWRYRTLAHRLGLLGPTPASSRPGLIILQLDALSHDNLLQAIADGYLPHLRTAIASGAYQVVRWRSDLPTDTPSIQAGLLYGQSDGVVGYYWYERTTDRRVSCANPVQVREIQARLTAQGQPALLAGGSCYNTLFGAGASRPVLALAEMLPLRLFSRGGWLRLGLAIALFPGVALRLLADLAWEVAVETIDSLVAPPPRRRGKGSFALGRVILNVLLREVATFGIELDIAAGRSPVFANFLGYDLVGHHSGPTSNNARRVLRGLDRAVARIRRMAGESGRPYHVFVLSDHGLAETVPFEQLHGQTISQLVASLVDGPGSTGSNPDCFLYASSSYLASLNLDLGILRRNLRPPLDRLLGPVVDRLARRNPLSLARSRAAVVASSLITHVYLRGQARPLALPEIERRCPGLAGKLAHHPGIGLVVARSGGDGEVIVRSAGGQTCIGAKGRSVEGCDPLAGLEDPDLMAAQIRRLGRLEGGGDLILFGAQQNGRFTSFEAQFGSHGTFGGGQEWPFFLVPAGAPPPGQLAGGAALYEYLRRVQEAPPGG